jgi:hypothetical protein
VSDGAKQKTKPEPDAELLEFLGDIDEANDEGQDEDFSDFLANHDIEQSAHDANKPRPPVKHE